MFYLQPKKLKETTRLHWRESVHSFDRNPVNAPSGELLLNFHQLRALDDHRLFPGGTFEPQVLRNTCVFLHVLEGELAIEYADFSDLRLTKGQSIILITGPGAEYRISNASSKTDTRVVEGWFRDSDKRKAPIVIPLPRARKKGQDIVSTLSGLPESLHILPWEVYVGAVAEGHVGTFRFAREESHSWLHLIQGKVIINEIELHEGDGLGIGSESILNISASHDSAFLLIEMR